MVILLLSFLLVATWVADRTRMDEMPIYHSPWVFPVYKYYPKDNDVVPYTTAVNLFFAVSFLVLVWSIWATVEIQPRWVGVNTTCAVEIVVLIVCLFFMNTNNVQYNKIKDSVDKLVIKTAWLDAKENLVKML